MITSPLVRGGAAVPLAAAVACGLAGCGGSDAPAGSTAATGGPGRMDPALRQKIDDCLQAAGLPVPTRRPRPSGTPEPPPSGTPDAQGGYRGQFADPKVQAALKACGITLPTRNPNPNSTGTPTP